jgi:glycolate oxidase
LDLITESIITELQRMVGKQNVLTSPEGLKTYSYDGTTTWVHQPDVVLFPLNTKDLSEVMKLANREKMPVTPRGGGTNVSGGSIPVMGGIVLCLSKMNRITKIDKENMMATVEAGVVLQDFVLELAKEGLFFPPDPQSFYGATIGGIIAENAGGPSCLKYGVTKQYVLGMEVVLPTGDIVNLGGRTLNNVIGYDLLHIIISSEGTLGVVTRADLQLKLTPPTRKTIMAVYDDAAVAGENVSKVLEAGVIPTKIEYIDNWIINKIEETMPFGLPKDAEAVLLFETDGSSESVEWEAKVIVEVAQKHGARYVRIAGSADEANQFWMARRVGASALYRDTKTVLVEDVTVPRGNLPALIKRCKELAKKYNLEIVALGHAGDGNLHPAILTDITDKEHYKRASQAMEEIFHAAVEFGGVLSGEHGIGLEKQKFFTEVVDPIVLSMMKKIKTLLDPNNIMNPGKIWDQSI